MQVVIFHAKIHLNIEFSGILKNAASVLSLFPGVPIFFVISGYLITAAYEKHPEPLQYFKNRFLRIYPALWACFFLSVLILFLLKHMDRCFVTDPLFVPWIVSQITFLQFFNPEYLRTFGVGVVNGSLWTIPVELQFYVVVPLLYAVSKRFSSRGFEKWIVVGFMMFSVGCWYLMEQGPNRPLIGTDVFSSETFGEAIFYKLLRVSLLPYLFMFMLGSCLFRYRSRLSNMVNGKVILWTVGYVCFDVIYHRFSFDSWIMFIGQIVSRILLSFWVISFAFSFKNVSRNILRGYDLSYGIYLYHMLMVNLAIELEQSGNILVYFLVPVGSAIMAFFSWTIIEKPALQMKKVSYGRMATS